MKQPFPREWEEILRGNVALYQHLPADLRERLHGYINVFLDEKKFEGSSYVAWARIPGREYGELVEKVKKHHKDVIDSYGATNPAEFFAVITEAFFKKPAKLKQKHPALCEELKLYYKMDPLQWG